MVKSDIITMCMKQCPMLFLKVCITLIMSTKSFAMNMNLIMYPYCMARGITALQTKKFNSTQLNSILFANHITLDNEYMRCAHKRQK